MRTRRFPFSVGTILVVLAILVGFLYRQYIVDQINIWTYTPNSEVKSLANDNKLSNLGQRYLYASRAQIDDRSDFNKFCGLHEPTQTVLGCYVDTRIYVFDVTNKELDGVMQVTAAHEMLHAAYARLSDSELTEVDGMLSSAEKTLTNDKAFAKRMAVYNQLPRSQYLDELHSVLGTEVKHLPSGLSNYYSRYFEDRAVVVSYYQQYAKVFANLQTDAAQLIAQLDTLATNINSAVRSYNSTAAELSRDIASFNTRAKQSGGFSTQQRFNSERDSLVARSDALDQQRIKINSLISQYQSGLEKLNSMEAHLTTLNSSIDSDLTPIPEVKSGN